MTYSSPENPLDDWFDPSLPPELRAAPLEFDRWSQQQLLVEQNESTPTKALYHYARETGIKGILISQKLWCFSHLHQSDPSEFKYSLNAARRVMRTVGKSKDFITRHLCACIEDLLVTNGLETPFEFYLFSLSRHRDHKRQWREFGDKGRGLAIGFSPALFQPDQPELSPQAHENVLIGRVVYGEGQTTARHRLVIKKAAEIASRFERENTFLVRKVKPSLFLVTMAREVIASQLVWNCVTAKKAKFEEEQEVRAIVMNVRERFDGSRRCLNGRPYIETPLPLKDKGRITEILVGPLAPADAEETMAAFLKAEGYSYTIPIIRSSVSLGKEHRGTWPTGAARPYASADCRTTRFG
jgi:hypothetical protein